VIIIHQGQIVAQDRIENLATQERGQSRLTIRTRKEVADLKKVLSGIEGVLAVTHGATTRDWEVNIRGDESIVDAISSRVVGEGLGLLELSPHKMDLEDVFLKLTYGSDEKGAQV